MYGYFVYLDDQPSIELESNLIINDNINYKNPQFERVHS